MTEGTTAEGNELVTFDEIKSNFALPFKYGDKTQPWPNDTIVLYKHNLNGEWRRQGSEGRHAELNMIADMENENVSEVVVFLSYSPCSLCCTNLIEFTTQNKCSMKIRFSNFYKSFEIQNLICLADLDIAGIQLEVFEDTKHWEKLVKMANTSGNPSEIVSKDRNERQEVDKLILECVLELSHTKKTRKRYRKKKNEAAKEDYETAKEDYATAKEDYATAEEKLQRIGKAQTKREAQFILYGRAL